MEKPIENVMPLIKKIDSYTKKHVSESRYEHSVRTAQMCKKLCGLYSLDEDLGYLAGISHDMCKNLDKKEMLLLASKDGEKIGELEKEKPSLLHGRAAAVMLKRDFEVSDRRILEAVAVHTFGKVGMGDYAKVLFVSDKIEPGREHITCEYLSEVYKLSLNRVVEKVLSENIEYLKKCGKKVAPESIKVLEWIRTLK